MSSKPFNMSMCPVVFYLKELKHTLEHTVKSLCAEAGLRGNQHGVDEQLIQDVTGHGSSAVRSYKRTNDAMKIKITINIIK